ncbi:MAG: hypothetical protein ACJ78Q_04900 [Chloroflexia bacterium]
MSNYSIDVHMYMERGMYQRLVDRAKELGVPLSAVVRDAVVRYFEDIPEVPDSEIATALAEDPIWQLPQLHETYGPLSVPAGPGGQG